MKKRIIKVILFVMLLVVFNSIVYADTKSVGQTEVSKYALSWDGKKEMKYVFGGPGGRSGPMTLEECLEHGAGFDCSAFTSMVYRHFGIEIPAQSESQRNAAVKTFSNEEDAVPGDICWWSGHVAIYIGDGKIIHTNTSKPPTNYPHVSDFGNGEYRKPALYLRMVKDINDLKPLNGDDKKEVQEKVEKVEGYGSLVTESDLNGMEIPEFLEAYRQQVTTADRNMLSESEKNHLAEINGNKDATRNVETISIRVFHYSQSFIGIMCILYGILIFISYLFDYYNSFFDISLLAILTFGKLRVLDSYEIKGMKKGYDTREKITYVTMGGVIFRGIFLVLIGIFLISGVFGNLIYSLWDYVIGLFNK